MEDDDYFELMIRNALKPVYVTDETGKFRTTHATARRVLVLHTSGDEEIIGKQRVYERNLSQCASLFPLLRSRMPHLTKNLS